MVLTRKVLFWTVPSLLCLILYLPGMHAWFQKDDFAWLALHRKVQDLPSFLDALFRPYAQGTIRPWTERLFFLVGYWTFGLDALPFRVTVFSTQFCNLALVAHVTKQLTRSPVAAFLAPILWTASGACYLPLTWTSAFNQVLCATFLLTAFAFFIKYTQSNNKSYYWKQFLVFVIGFGTLELNAVYPGIAFLYAICCARRYVWRTLPLFAISLFYTVVNRSLIRQDNSIYRMVWDAEILPTFGTYVRWTFSADRLATLLNRDGSLLLLAGTLAGAALLAFTLHKLWHRQPLALFFVGWFVGSLLPFLPLRFHVSDYYLYFPIVGLCMLGAWAIAEGWQSSHLLRCLSVSAALLYALPNVWEARYYSKAISGDSQQVKTLVTRMAYINRIHPGKTILLRGVSNSLFGNGVYDHPFIILGMKKVYLTQDSEPVIRTDAHKGISQHFLPDALALKLLRAREAVVYQVEDRQLTNVTSIFTRILVSAGNTSVPNQIQAGSPAFEGQLGRGWFQSEQGRFRWMGKAASVTLRGPSGLPGMLTLRGHCPELQIASGPLLLKLRVDGHPFPARSIDASNLTFQFTYPLPDSLAHAEKILIELEVSRTVRLKPDTREVGLVFGEFEVRP